MDRAFESGAIGIAPTAPAIPSVGFPTGGNPVGGVPATKPGAHWFHMVTEELRALIVAGGLTPSPSVVDQVLQALPAALASRPEMARSFAGNGYQRFPGGLILQWGSTAFGPSGTGSINNTITFPIAFPNALRCRLVSPWNQNGGALNTAIYAVSGTNTQLTIAAVSSGGFTTLEYGWIAIGN